VPGYITVKVLRDECRARRPYHATTLHSRERSDVVRGNALFPKNSPGEDIIVEQLREGKFAESSIHIRGSLTGPT
jgi:hypothetical protein